MGSGASVGGVHGNGVFEVDEGLLVVGLLGGMSDVVVLVPGLIVVVVVGRLVGGGW